ncbi:three prime repair exonuclease 2-like isoform X2 [Helicoverpa zea]|uniref:three prime repair exonuclease 2-like isoform X2 n=1 Tax=Helicoverpa zea TaxID=7113 RepID=UPI001F58F4B5|nr:three prime repair exonuclease 2-like isoform X2 [Helicoverpa zea]XP_047019090.1 three prime repair exonuclease 2-like isoform X2 [Helicoverpa zea]XP_047019091.1 three prime repair exonuclease 2-like isoform X2 [Helicoverpa zea]
MGKIATYIFFDIQSNGYPGPCHIEVQIAEICMIAVKRMHIEAREEQPRTLNKFKMCFRLRYVIADIVALRSGLTKPVLKNEAEFNKDVFNIINTFISCQEKPVCMIAHNAFEFHFPLLKYHFHQLKVSLPNDILCTDSLYALYDIMEPENNKNTIHNKPGRTAYKNVVRTKYYDVKPKESYRLSDIYSRVINGDLTPYNSENNCKMIMKLAIEKSEEFVAWVERNHCLFSEVPIMYM